MFVFNKDARFLEKRRIELQVRDCSLFIVPLFFPGLIKLVHFPFPFLIPAAPIPVHFYSGIPCGSDWQDLYPSRIAVLHDGSLSSYEGRALFSPGGNAGLNWMRE